MADRLAASYAARMAIASRKQWKKEQDEPNKPKNYAKVDVELHTFSLPPYVLIKVEKGKHTRKVSALLEDKALRLGYKVTGSKQREPAYYSITLPDGRSADMEQRHGSWKAKANIYESYGVRDLAKRLGFNKDNAKGGDTEFLNKMLGFPEQIEWIDSEDSENEDGTPKVQKVWKYLPTYEATIIENHWLSNVWRVKVGWKPNPKATDSSFWLINGELTQNNPNRYEKDGEVKYLTKGEDGYLAPLSMSLLEYTEISAPSIELTEDADPDKASSYMNDDEEFLTFCPQREDDPDFIDFSKYVWQENRHDDCFDEETELLTAASNVIERSEGGLTMGDLQSKAFTDDYLNDGIESAKETIARCLKQEPSELSEQIIGWMQDKISRLVRLTDLHNAFVTDNASNAIVRYWYPHTHGMWTMGRDFDSYKEPVKTQDCMLITPLNEIEKPSACEADEMPEHRNVRFTWTPENRSDVFNRRRTLKARRMALSFNPQTLRDNAAANAFANSLEEALRA